MKKSAASSLFNSSPLDRAFLHIARNDADVHDALMPFLKEAAKWEHLPKGWTQDSVKKFWDSLTGEVKHKVTKCMKEMEGKVDNTGAFCGSLADVVDPGWRSRRAVDLDKEFTGVGALADSAFKLLLRGVRTRVFGDSVEVAVAEFTKSIWNFPQAPQIRNRMVYAKLGALYDMLGLSGSTRSTRPATEWGLSELEPVSVVRVTALYAKKIPDQIHAAVFCLVVLKKAKMLQVKSKVEALFKTLLKEEIELARSQRPAKPKAEAIKALPDSYKQASKVAFVSSEQKATDALVKLVGGESRATELMNIWQSVQGLTKPLYGTTLERLYGTGKVSPVKNFIVKARNNRFSDAAIKHYVEQIQKEKVPTDWKKLKKEANEEIKGFSKMAKNQSEGAPQWRPYNGRPLQLSAKELQWADEQWTVVVRPQPNGKWMVAVVRVEGAKGYPWGPVAYVSDQKDISEITQQQLRMVSKMSQGGNMADSSRLRRKAGDIEEAWGPLLKQSSGIGNQIKDLGGTGLWTEVRQ